MISEFYINPKISKNMSKHSKSNNKDLLQNSMENFLLIEKVE